MKADSGATKTYLKPAHMTYLKKVTKLLDPQSIYLPNNTSLTPTHTGVLHLHPSLPDKAQEARVVPGLSNSSLFLTGQACDEGCCTVFSASHLYIICDRKTVITGRRNTVDGLWDIPFKSEPSAHHAYARQALNIIVNKTQSKTDLAKYLHGCAFSLVISTFKTTIGKGNFVTWSGIALINFDKSVVPTVATAKGHLDQDRQGLQATKQQIKVEEAHYDAFPSQQLSKTR